MSQPRRRGRYEHTALLRVAVVIVVAESGYPVIVAASGAVSSDSRCQRLHPSPLSPHEIVSSRPTGVVHKITYPAQTTVAEKLIDNALS